MAFNADNGTEYRRGVILGLTLAELLLLLLFLFLLIMSAILHERQTEHEELEGRFAAAEEERIAFRNALAGEIEISLGSELASNTGQTLTREQLDAPLARLGRMSSDNQMLRSQLQAAQSELTELRESRPITEQEASALREENSFLNAQLAALEQELGDVAQLVAQANSVDQERTAAEVLQAAMTAYDDLSEDDRLLPDELAACRAERTNLGSQLAYTRAQCGREGDLPPCVYRDDGSVAYSYNVVLSQAGITVGQGDEGSFRSIPWVAALPDPRLDQPISLGEFLRSTRTHFEASQQQDPECRFFVRIYDQMGDASRQEFLDQYLGVQNHFYHLLVRGG